MKFEQFQSMLAEPIKRCPKCKKLGVKRLVGKGAGLIFKGSGFYITDYKKTSAPKESGEGGSTGGESKPPGGRIQIREASGSSSEAAKNDDRTSRRQGKRKPAAKEKPKGEKRS